jgi:hypothetical protein
MKRPAKITVKKRGSRASHSTPSPAKNVKESQPKLSGSVTICDDTPSTSSPSVSVQQDSGTAADTQTTAEDAIKVETPQPSDSSSDSTNLIVNSSTTIYRPCYCSRPMIDRFSVFAPVVCNKRCTSPTPFQLFSPDFVKRIHNWWVGNPVSHNDHVNANALIQAIDEPSDILDHLVVKSKHPKGKESKDKDPEVPPVEINTTTPRNRRRYTSAIVAMCKTSLPGIGVYSDANRKVAHEWLFRKMTDHGIRPSHIQVILPLALECVFIDNSYELEAKRFVQTHAYLDRVEDGNKDYHSTTPAWLLRPFGSRRRMVRRVTP